MYRLAFVVLAALVALLAPPTSAEVLPFVAGCGRGGYGTVSIKEVHVNPCPQALNRRPCVLRKGTTVGIEVHFTSNVTSAPTATARAFWSSRNGDLPLPNMQTDACQSLICPIQAGSEQVYRYDLAIARSFPSRRYDVKWKMQSGPFNMCFQFPIAIQ